VNRHPRPSALAGAVAAAVLVAGCGSSSAGGPVFKTQSNLQINAAGQSCMVHQTQKPTKAYEGGTSGTTSDVLTFLAYYTANGNKKFCDGKAANSHDKAWAALFINLDGQQAASSVKGITG
jgi:hypothetical protein